MTHYPARPEIVVLRAVSPFYGVGKSLRETGRTGGK
jgi:hypothetical protein